MSVPTIISNANARIDTAVTEAQSFINQLSEIASDDSLGLNATWTITPWLDLSPGHAIPEAEEVSYWGPLSRRSLELETQPALPDDPSTDQPEVWDDANFPVFTDEPLPLDIPDRVTTPAPTAPPDPSVRDIRLAGWDSYDMPEEPGRTESPLPNVPTVSIDETDLSVPDISTLAPAPNNSFEFVETTYSSELKTALTNLLVSDVQDGGYGINPDDEQKLWDRARDRQTKLNQAALQKAHRGIAAGRLPLPPGAWFAAQREVEMEGDAALNDTNREIALKRSDLYVQARQFAVTQGLTLERALLDYTGAKQERALKTAMAAADFVLKFHNATVQLVQLRVDVRRLYRELHEEQRASAIANLESFRGELQLIEAEEGRNEGRLRFYEGLRRGVLDLYEVQRLRDQHNMLDAEIERLYLEASKVRAELYATKVRARSDEFDGYAKAITGERLKVDLYTAQADAHDTLVDSAYKESQRKEARFEAELARKLDERERVKLLLSKAEARLRRAVAETETDAEHNKELIEIWNRQQQTKQFNVSTKLQRDIEKARAFLRQVQTNTGLLTGTLQAINNYKELKATAAKSGVQLYETQIAGAENALSAVAALVESG